MKTYLTSKERIIAVIAGQRPDHLPICFNGFCHGWVEFLARKYQDQYKRISHFLELGIDTAFILSADWKVAGSDIRINDWTEQKGGDTLIHREYLSSIGLLRQTVRKNRDYPRSTINLFDDYNVPPERSVKYLVDREEELEALEHLFNSRISQYRADVLAAAPEVKQYCEENGVMLTGNLSGVGDPLIWMSGVENIIYAAIDKPAFLQKYIEIVSKWNMRQLEVFLEAGADLILRRGWYESTDFWSPELYKKFLFGPLKKEVDMAHEADVKYSYIMNSGATPLAGIIKETGIDILSNIEPDKNDIARIQNVIGSGVTLCGGVNNYHVIERGTEEDVEKAVRDAYELFADRGRYIMAPSDAILDISETAQRNFYKMLEVWRELV